MKLLTCLILLAALALTPLTPPAGAAQDTTEGSRDWGALFSDLGCVFAGAVETAAGTRAWGLVTDAGPLTKLGFKDVAEGWAVTLSELDPGRLRLQVGRAEPGAETQEIILAVE